MSNPIRYKLVPAGFWLCFAAMLIDNLLINLVFCLMLVTLLLFDGAIDRIPTLAPRAAFWASMFLWLAYGFVFEVIIPGGVTPAKKLLGLCVRDMHGQQIGFGKALGRWAGKFLSWLLFYIGFLMAAWTSHKQGLHDLMAGTLVLRRIPANLPTTIEEESRLS